MYGGVQPVGVYTLYIKSTGLNLSAAGQTGAAGREFRIWRRWMFCAWSKIFCAAAREGEFRAPARPSFAAGQKKAKAGRGEIKRL